MTLDSPNANSPQPTRHAARRYRACALCDWVSAVPVLRPGEEAQCPRCQHVIARRHRHPVQRSLALAISALLCLMLALSYPLCSIDIAGQTQALTLMGTANGLASAQQPLVALVVALVMVVIPAGYLLCVIAMQLPSPWALPHPVRLTLARGFSHCHPWMMADVFVVAILVSLVKLVGLAEVLMGPAFWAYCVFSVLLLWTTRSVDEPWLWRRLCGPMVPPWPLHTGMTAAAQGMRACGCCGAIQMRPNDTYAANDVAFATHTHRLSSQTIAHSSPASTATTNVASCVRCGSRFMAQNAHRQQDTWALLFTSVVLFIPANLYPMMQTTALGQTEANTLMSGIIALWQQDSQPIAVIIFIASIVVPVAKMLTLAVLNWSVRRPVEAPFSAITLYRLTEFVGRWSMVDVFVVAILVALIQTGNFMSITPGPAALAFCAVVILTMLAALRFDPRQLWSAMPTDPNLTSDRIYD